MSRRQRFYTAKFKAEVIKAIESNNGSFSEIARQLGISMQTLFNWCNKVKAGALKVTQQYSPDLVALLEENKELKQHLKMA